MSLLHRYSPFRYPSSWKSPCFKLPLLFLNRPFRHETGVVACLHDACRATSTAEVNPTDGGDGSGRGKSSSSWSSGSSLRRQRPGQQRGGRLIGASSSSSTGTASRGRDSGGAKRQQRGGGAVAAVRGASRADHILVLTSSAGYVFLLCSIVFGTQE